jgi:CheY-like chemotaxis protein
LREPSVLVVDDEELVGQLICDALEDAGYDVVYTESGLEAVALLASEGREWAGVVTDINLGRASPRGWDVARSARQATPAIAVIYVSGDSSHEWAVQGVPLSVMISKPFTASRVVVALADLLNARQGAL